MIGLNRRGSEKFYTKPCIADRCVSVLDKYIDDKNLLIIEPSAGNGSFTLDYPRVLRYDIEPEGEGIEKQDFLKLNINEDCVIVGNPPFGRQSCLAKSFIRHSCKFATIVAFILPKSFKKITMQKVFPICFHMIHQEDLPNNSFFVNGEDYNVPCIFQIWVRKNTNRYVKIYPKTSEFVEFVKKDENPDYAIRRVGVYAGKIYNTIKDKSPQSHYFLKVNREDFLELYIKNVKFIHDNTVGPKSVSKGELLEKINDMFN